MLKVNQDSAQVVIEIYNSNNEFIDRFFRPYKKGFNRASWDLTKNLNSNVNSGSTRSYSPSIRVKPGKYSFNVYLSFDGKVNKIGSKFFEVERIRSGVLNNPNIDKIDEYVTEIENEYKNYSLLSSKFGKIKDDNKSIISLINKSSNYKDYVSQQNAIQKSIDKIDKELESLIRKIVRSELESFQSNNKSDSLMSEKRKTNVGIKSNSGLSSLTKADLLSLSKKNKLSLSSKHTKTEILNELKSKAKSENLWNLFLPDKEYGYGLSNVDYAPLAEITGHNWWAPEVFNCSAPDTGNMEILAEFGTAEQKKQWLEPLLEGEIRSCFAMTEPNVASSDATNIGSSIVSDGDNYVINGRKWWTSNAINPNAKICIFMGVTNPDSPPYQRQSQVLVPMDSEGLSIIRPMQVFGYDDGYTGHPELFI